MARGRCAVGVNQLPQPDCALMAMRDVLTGGNVRQLAGIEDEGGCRVGVIAHPDGASPVEIDSKSRDIWVWAKDHYTGQFYRGRLFLACNALLRLPGKGESCMILRPAHCGTNGEPYILWGDLTTIPGWLDANNAGISTKESLHLNSTDGDVILKEGSRNVAREKDDLDVGTLQAMDGMGLPVTFTYVPSTATGPGAPSIGASVQLAGIVKAGTGNPHIKG